MQSVWRDFLRGVTILFVALFTVGVVSWLWESIGLMMLVVVFGSVLLCLPVAYKFQKRDFLITSGAAMACYSIVIMFAAVDQGAPWGGVMTIFGVVGLAACIWSKVMMIIAEKNEVIKKYKQKVQDLGGEVDDD